MSPWSGGGGGYLKMTKPNVNISYLIKPNVNMNYTVSISFNLLQMGFLDHKFLPI